MDGLPGMRRGLNAAKKYNVAPIKKMVGPLAPTRYRSGYGFTTMQVILIALFSFLIGLAVAYYGRVVIEIVSDSINGRPLEVKLDNLTQASPLESLAGFWSTK